jgi:hypothetical protein
LNIGVVGIDLLLFSWFNFKDDLTNSPDFLRINLGSDINGEETFDCGLGISINGSELCLFLYRNASERGFTSLAVLTGDDESNGLIMDDVEVLLGDNVPADDDDDIEYDPGDFASWSWLFSS